MVCSQCGKETPIHHFCLKCGNLLERRDTQGNRTSVNCPNCGLTNPSTAGRCDCGYQFTRSVVAPDSGARGWKAFAEGYSRGKKSHRESEAAIKRAEKEISKQNEFWLTYKEFTVVVLALVLVPLALVNANGSGEKGIDAAGNLIGTTFALYAVSFFARRTRKAREIARQAPARRS